METFDQKQVFEWGKQSVGITEKQIANCVNGAGMIGVKPAGLEIVNLKDYLPEYPERKEVKYTFTSVASFCQYVNEQKNEYSRIFAKLRESPYVFDAVIDHHQTAAGHADWCRHHAILELRLSEQFQTWKEIDGKMNPQAAFALYLKDNRYDIVTPDNASVLQLVMELEANADCRCVGKVPTNNGTAFSFREDVATSVNGQKVEVPTELTLSIPVFEGMPDQEIRCDFNFRMKEGYMFFGVKMLGVERMLRNAVMAARAEIEQVVELPVFV